MSARLIWEPPPVEPEQLGAVGHPAKGTIITALQTVIGSPWIDETSLRSQTVTVSSRDSAMIAYLQGVCDTLAGRDDDGERDELLGLLGDIDRLGSVQIRVVST